MATRTAVLVGISGVGKTTFLKRLTAAYSVKGFTASQIISEAHLSEKGKGLTSSTQTHGNSALNKEMLLKGFDLIRAKTEGTIVLDAHTIVKKVDGVKAIDSDVFRVLEIGLIMVLREDPSIIYEQRENDSTRNRDDHDVGELQTLQEESTQASIRLAKKLRIPCVIITRDDFHFAGRTLST